MYIVRDKESKTIIHTNPAPLRQKLTPRQVYALFEPETMEIGEIDGHLPEHFKINKKGKILELTLEEKVKAGIIKLEPGQKIKDNMMVEKTLSEKIADGLITLEPDQKVSGKGIDEKIVEKTIEEKVADGLITLAPDQKVVGTGEKSRIVEKTLTEKLNDGLLTLAPNQKITGRGENEKIVEKPVSEMVAEGIIKLEPSQILDGETIKTLTVREMFTKEMATLDGVKEECIAYYSQLALERRRAFLPDYKQQNAALGVYDDAKTAAIKTTIMKFKEEFNRLKGLIESAKTIKQIDAIKENFPKEIIK